MWCGADVDDRWTYAPCVVQTVGASLLLPLAILVAVRQYRFMKKLLLRRPSGHPYYIERNARFPVALITVFLTGIHVAWLTILSVPHPSIQPFEWFFNIVLICTWILTLGVSSWGMASRAPVRVRTTAVVGLLVYWGAACAWFARYWKELGSVSWVEWLGLGIIEGGALGSIVIIVLEHTRPYTEEQESLLSDEDIESGKEKEKSWLQLFTRALLYVWPRSVGLQVRTVVCLVLLLTVRALNLAVPILYKKVVNLLAEISTGNASPTTRKLLEGSLSFNEVFYPHIGVWLIALMFAGTGVGTGSILSTLRQYLFFPITQDAYRRISIELFSHLLELDLQYHMHRKTGEVMRVMDRGTMAIQNVLSTIIFNVGPQLIDMLVAIVYVSAFIEGWIGLVIIGTLAIYLPTTVLLTEVRRNVRKKLNSMDNKKSFKATDALLNYETVKYFNNEAFETQEYGKVVDTYQTVEVKFFTLLYALNAVQSIVMVSGVAGGVALCVKGVVDGHLTVGDFTLFLSLLQQLYSPLNFLGTYYRMIQNNTTDMENMFELIDTPPMLMDAPNAKPLQLSQGTIEFSNVTFGYNPDRTVLDDVTFKIQGGGSLALVGSTGSGKSTILRMLFRLYDPDSGSVKIDGQSLDTVTMASIHNSIAYVPQDTVLFNDTILYNIRYGKVTSSVDEVKNVAQMAAIHDKIVDRFPMEYETMVGERGVKLSGGEKQRVAFARAMLKNAPILILDEATSALDSITEKKIQESMMSLRENRTTIIVAHRLSTVMDVDTIVVMKDGKVVELGSHPQLIELKGEYAEMWEKQKEPGFDRNTSTMSFISEETE